MRECTSGCMPKKERKRGNTRMATTRSPIGPSCLSIITPFPLHAESFHDIRNGEHKFTPLRPPFLFAIPFPQFSITIVPNHSITKNTMTSRTILSPSLRPIREKSCGPDSRQQSPLVGSLSPAGSPAGERDTTFVQDSDEGGFELSQAVASPSLELSPLSSPASPVGAGGEIAGPPTYEAPDPEAEPRGQDVGILWFWELQGNLHTTIERLALLEERILHPEVSVEDRAGLQRMWDVHHSDRVGLQERLHQLVLHQQEQYAAMVQEHAEAVRRLDERVREQGALARAYWSRLEAYNKR